MSETFCRVLALHARGEIQISRHGYDELKQDNIRVRDAVAGLPAGVVVEDYPEYSPGPCVLVLECDRHGAAIHVLWGIRRGMERPAVLITAYRPDPAKWEDDFRRRRL